MFENITHEKKTKPLNTRKKPNVKVPESWAAMCPSSPKLTPPPPSRHFIRRPPPPHPAPRNPRGRARAPARRDRYLVLAARLVRASKDVQVKGVQGDHLAALAAPTPPMPRHVQHRARAIPMQSPCTPHALPMQSQCNPQAEVTSGPQVALTSHSEHGHAQSHGQEGRAMVPSVEGHGVKCRGPWCQV